MKTNKRFLGDGVYAAFDGWHIVLTAENGILPTDTIYLDSAVYRALTEYSKAYFFEDLVKSSSAVSDRSADED